MHRLFRPVYCAVVWLLAVIASAASPLFILIIEICSGKFVFATGTVLLIILIALTMFVGGVFVKILLVSSYYNQET